MNVSDSNDWNCCYSVADGGLRNGRLNSDTCSPVFSPSLFQIAVVGSKSMMNKAALTALTGAVCIWTAPASIADAGVADACQDEIKELQEKINDSKDDYTAESRRRAKNHLLAAKTNRLNPAKCRGNILDARKELQEGKKDRRKKDKDKSD